MKEHAEDRESSGSLQSLSPTLLWKRYLEEDPFQEVSSGFKDNGSVEQKPDTCITSASLRSTRRNLLEQFRECSEQECTENLPGHQPRTPIAGRKRQESERSTLFVTK